MSINTANLITTENGQAELAEVHRLNARLSAERREISIVLMFPYMAISNKTGSEISAISSVTDLGVKSERCWSNVDICQLQTYTSGRETKRDFTIGGLFDVRSDITDARTIILFAQTRIIDSRTDAKKAEDGGASAYNVVSNEYGYTPKMLTYAYTLILDETGTHPEGGIKIGESKYGRSRHRFYFNYIIDNNTGIADNITVNDSVYPYSDGYLSKTAFELGLKRYEDALKSYRTEYEKYANGRNTFYENMEEAIKLAVPRHKFLLKNQETNTAFPDVDLQKSQGALWPDWPTAEDGISSDEPYKGYSAANYGSFLDDSIDTTRAILANGIHFEYKDVRPIEFITINDENGESASTIKYLPVRFKFFMFNRSAVPYQVPSQHDYQFEIPVRYDSLYHAMRVWVTIKDGDDNLINGGFEILDYADDGKAITPICPAVGKIKIVDKNELRISMLVNEVYVSEKQSPGESTGPSRVFTEECSFKLLTWRDYEGTNATVTMKNSLSFEISQYTLDRGSGGRLYINGQLVGTLNPNFAGGYSFSEYTPIKNPSNATKIYEFPKLFDCEQIDIWVAPSATAVGTPSKYVISSNAISNDIVVSKSNSSGFNYIIKDGLIVYEFPYSEPKGFQDREIVFRTWQDVQLHNARVYLLGDAEDAKQELLLFLAYINGKSYKLEYTLDDFLQECGSDIDPSTVNFLSVKRVWVDPWGELGVQCEVRYIIGGDESGVMVEYATAEISTPTPSNLIRQFVAIEDVDGSTNIIEETLT